MGLFSFLFSNKSNIIKSYIEKGAIILDVRTQKEYDTNHINNAIHIPIAELNSRIEELKKLNKPIIAHCESGIRSAKAAHVLKTNGMDAINGGGIAKVKSALV